jgi:hypothetical protein
MEVKKEISYLGKDFSTLRSNLIEFTKQYFPTTYTDFNESDPGTMLIELSAYVGDVLSYYIDSNLKESLITQASERANLLELSTALGYKPKNVSPAYVTLDVYQLLPAIGSGDAVRPDYDFALNVKPGLRVSNDAGSIEFRTVNYIDFNFSSSINPTEVSVYETDDATSLPTYYLLKKQVTAVSGKVKTATFTFNSAIPFDKIVLPDKNVIDIISVEETDGDNWYQVPYLAKETIMDELPNIVENDPELSEYRSSTPSLLRLKRVAKRYVTRLRSDNKTELQFGSGISSNNDEEIIPNPTNVGNGLTAFQTAVDIDIDPSNFLYTQTYGLAPANTTLTVTYTVGSGVIENVAPNVLTKVQFADFQNNINSTVSQSTLQFIKRSISVNNDTPAVGAKNVDSLENIRNNALSNFATQNRSVTDHDYVIRCYSMPSKFGSVAKAYIVPDDQISQQQQEQGMIANPLALNLYTLGYNENKQLISLNSAIKQNLKRYIDYYRMLTDAVNIKDAFIVNIGLNFSISVLPNYNSNEVLLKCIDNLKTYFNIDRWSVNQPIIKSEIINLLGKVQGVQNVVSVSLYNLYDSDLGYSGNVYDLTTATRNGIIYPSLDPSIFELKYPNQDIKGQVV